MANNKESDKKLKENNKNSNNRKQTQNGKKNPSNTFIMKLLVFLGVIILCGIIIYLMNYFFVEKSYIKINMSTDKKLENITIGGKEELITTQKYVSDLDYSIRYDVNKFTIFKYKKQDIFKYIDAEKVLLVVEKSTSPGNCVNADLDTEYNNCLIKVDNYTDEYYISANGHSYKITIKSPNTSDYEKNIKDYIDYMLNSFEMNF